MSSARPESNSCRERPRKGQRGGEGGGDDRLNGYLIARLDGVLNLGPGEGDGEQALLFQVLQHGGLGKRARRHTSRSGAWRDEQREAEPLTISYIPAKLLAMSARPPMNLGDRAATLHDEPSRQLSTHRNQPLDPRVAVCTAGQHPGVSNQLLHGSP